MKDRSGYSAVKYTTHEEDKRLVKCAIEGDQSAYNTLLRKYKPILYTAAKRRLSNANPDDLEDIVMIVLGNSFVKIRQYDSTKSLFFTWMVACLHNYVNSIPGQKKRVKADSLNDIYPSSGDENEFVEYNIPDIDNFDTNMDKEQTSKLLRLLISKLPPDISKAITMKYFTDSTNDEIANAIGCRTSEIWYKIKRGKDLLKRMSDKDNLF